eukprot:1193561-Prorocentrum_minimum.AAC.4
MHSQVGTTPLRTVHVCCYHGSRPRTKSRAMVNTPSNGVCAYTLSGNSRRKSVRTISPTVLPPRLARRGVATHAQMGMDRVVLLLLICL